MRRGALAWLSVSVILPLQSMRRDLLHDQSDRSNRAAGAVAHLERETDKKESLTDKPVEATQLLHHADAIAQPDSMGRPPPFGRIIHADEIGRKQRDAAVDEPLRAVGRNEGTVLDPSWRSPLLVAAGPADDCRTAANGAPGFRLGRLEIADRDCLAFAPVCQIEQMARKNELLERHLRYRQAGLVEMTRRVEMRAAMLGHQHHPRFHRELAFGYSSQTLKAFDRPKGDLLVTDIGHPGVQLVGEIDDFFDRSDHLVLRERLTAVLRFMDQPPRQPRRPRCPRSARRD